MKTQSSVFRTTILATAFAITAGSWLASSDAQAGEPSESSRVMACQNYRVAYAKSSARKLFRALRARGQDHRKVGLQSWVDAAPRGASGSVRFDVYFQHDGLVAGVVPTRMDVKTTYVVAMTDVGPIVASHEWPTADELARGARDCRPTASHIRHPATRVAELDVEPFDFWGLRVVWQIPSERGENEPNAYQALMRAIQNGPVAQK